MDIKEALEIAEHRCIASGDATEQACMALTAEYRRLTELRPMSEAPVGVGILLNTEHGLEIGIFCGDGDCVLDNELRSVAYFEGWLPLPKVGI